MPLKSCVQHLACRTGILLQSKTPAPPHFPIKKKGPKSAKLTPKGGLVLAVRLARELALLWITSQVIPATLPAGGREEAAAGGRARAGGRAAVAPPGSHLGARPGASPAAQPRSRHPSSQSRSDSRALRGSRWLGPTAGRGIGPFPLPRTHAGSSVRRRLLRGCEPAGHPQAAPPQSCQPAGGDRPRRAPLGAAILSPRRLQRLPRRASAEPAAVHVARLSRFGSPAARSPGKAEPRPGGRGDGRPGSAGPRGAGAGRRKRRAARERGTRSAPARPGSRLLAPAPPRPARPPPPPIPPGGRCSRDRPPAHPASPLPRLQPPPAELHYARQFRHFAKTKTRARRKRRTRRTRRRRERRQGQCEPGTGRVFGTPPFLFSSGSPRPVPTPSPRAPETSACLRPR